MLSGSASTPVVGDGRVFVAAFWPGGEPEDRPRLPSFDELLAQSDKNADGEVSKEELSPDLVLLRRSEIGEIFGAEIKLAGAFALFDANGDDRYDRREWTKAVDFSLHGREHGLIAIRPGGTGNVTKSHVAWREGRCVAEVPSPLFYRGRVYMLKDGGILSCLDAGTGRLLYRERLGPVGAYFSSPVAGDGKIYAASHRGTMVVCAAGDSFQRLGVNPFDEAMFATPAIAAGVMYIRTEKQLYAIHAPSSIGDGDGL
jgi:outer membrane protein assembly factor BamB